MISDIELTGAAVVRHAENSEGRLAEGEQAAGGIPDIPGQPALVGVIELAGGRSHLQRAASAEIGGFVRLGGGRWGVVPRCK